MITSAVGFALLAALSPTALLVAAVYLGSASPHRTMLYYLAGAVVMTLVVGIIVLAALRAGGLSLRHSHSPRYGLRLGLGVLALGGGLFMTRRKPKPRDPAKKKKPGLMSRMMARPAPLAAFVTGIIVFIPSVSYVAAVQAIATANSDVLDTSLVLAAVIVIDLALVWLPFLLFLAAPDPTARRLKAFNGWLRAHGHAIAAGALLVAGALLIGNGIFGLS